MRRIHAAAACVLAAGLALPVSPAQGADARSETMKIVRTLALDGFNPRTESRSATGSAAPEGPFCSPVERATEDRPDLHDGHLVHVVYLVAADADDARYDVDGTLACSIQTQNEWFRKQSGLEWRWDTAVVDTTDPNDPNRRVETLDVTFIRSTHSSAELAGAAQVSAELEVRGFDTKGKRYLTYVEGGNNSGVCGDAFYPLASSPPASDGQYAQVYLDSVDGCGARDIGSPSVGGGLSEAIAQQELIHNDSMTPIGAPHTCTNAGIPYGHVCTGPLFVLPEVDPEGRDVMFPYVYFPLRDKVLDRGHDDYFGHSLPIGLLDRSPYLQTANAWGAPLVEPRSGSTGQEGAPDPNTSPATRSIDAQASKARVRSGTTVEISGRIDSAGACTADQPVTLERRVGRSDRVLEPRHTHTDGDGSFSFDVTVRRTTTFTAVVDATDECAAARSRPLRVRTIG